MEFHFGLIFTCTELKRLQTLKFNQSGRKKIIAIFYSDRRETSAYATKFWRQNVLTVWGHWGWLLHEIYGRCIPPVSIPSSQESRLIDFEGLLQDSRLQIPKFTRSDLNRGKTFIDSICAGGKFVCLNVRDSGYYESPVWQKSNADYHYYRDSDIATYGATAETLAEMGYTVFRMGAVVKEPLVSKHPRVIDYATNGMRTEFLDIFLGAHCTFCISTGAGWDSVPTVFRRPIMFVNALPTFAPSMLVLKSLIYPKSLVEIENQYELSLTDIAEKKLATTDHHMIYRDEFGEPFTDLRNAGVLIRDLSSEELVEAVTEMAQRVEGTFVETPEQKEMQAKLKHILSTHPKLQPTPNYYPIRSEFASCFLSRYPNFLD